MAKFDSDTGTKNMILFPYFFVAAIFMMLTGYSLFAEGMFVDGVTYAAISRNLADGLGSFWDPFLSATLYPHFHQHPPLALGLQGLAFRIFGDSLLIERFYSIATFFITGYLIVLIWTEITGDKKSGWIPLLLWISFPLISWAAASNLLDNTLSVFTTLSILFILRSSSRKKNVFLVIAGLSLFAGLLTKGPFALFPWVLPFLWEFRQPAFILKKAITKTMILVLATLIPLIILIAVSADARVSLQTYWTDQLVSSLSGVKTVSSRWYILGTIISQLVVPLLMAAITVLIFRLHIDKEKIRKYRKASALFLLLGLSGVLPVMISMKQSSFYILPALPAFALMIALPVFAILEGPLDRMNAYPRSGKILRNSALVILVLSIVVPPLLARYNPRDKDKLAMINDFSTVIPAGTTVRINPALAADWSLYSYFSRMSQISLDPSDQSSSSYYLDKDTARTENNIAANWLRIRQIKGYVLFKK